MPLVKATEYRAANKVEIIPDEPIPIAKKKEEEPVPEIKVEPEKIEVTEAPPERHRRASKKEE